MIISQIEKDLHSTLPNDPNKETEQIDESFIIDEARSVILPQKEEDKNCVKTQSGGVRVPNLDMKPVQLYL